ncbi:GNAT family N-acetyltransferase [uncultured Bacteroides sp.]|uniref:GNAT family N-acetyltransferase n=1 Tax=uncultured Bacteroides sp. TaxID=162156 RepID=UPI0026298E08|nr:GNAT family N-acetyltransferase [uncultured Bacteroides sp.]
MDLKVIPKPDEISWESITKLLHEAFTEHVEQGLHYSACDQTAEITRKRCENGICLIALFNGVLVGTGTVSFFKKEGEKYASLSQMAVLPEYKKFGFGSKIRDEIIKICFENGIEAIYCNTSEKAIKIVNWYVNAGWQKVGMCSYRETNYYSVIFRYPIMGHKYTRFNVVFRYNLSKIICKLIWLEDGTLSYCGRFLKRIKLFCKTYF